MSIIDCIKQIDWKNSENRVIAEAIIRDATEYMRRVEAHIFRGNEIRADQWMDYSEKQDEIRKLDRKRTEAHNKLLVSAGSFIDLLDEQTEFNRTEYRLDNRTQIADFVAAIAFDLTDMVSASKVEGSVRDELAEKIHNGEITIERINDAAAKLLG